MKILVPVDGSEASGNAVKHAYALAKAMSKPAKLVVLAVDDSLFPGVERKIGAEAAARLVEENHARMLAPARKALARCKLPVEMIGQTGDIAQTILDTASKGKFDMIVMGSRGNGGLKGTLLGSISLKLLAHSPVPVTIVR